jgi:hypothetical protein
MGECHGEIEPSAAVLGQDVLTGNELLKMGRHGKGISPQQAAEKEESANSA